MSRRLRRRYGRAAGAKDPMAAFRTAARKIERAIVTLADGGVRDSRPVFAAINRLGDRSNKPEIRGDDVLRTEAWAIESDLRKRASAAQEAGVLARQALRREEIAAITAAERERIANMSPSERATHAYQQELKIMRGSR
jgi:hypothetical protein